jgi:hypothetical protein
MIPERLHRISAARAPHKIVFRSAFGIRPSFIDLVKATNNLGSSPRKLGCVHQANILLHGTALVSFVTGQDYHLGALDIHQLEPAGTEYGDVNQSTDYRDIADKEIFHHRAHFQWPLEGPEPDIDE